MTAIKICGLCRPDDAAAAVLAGAGYLGVILSPHGPRAQSAEQAARVLAPRAGVETVGVFVDETASRVVELVRALRLDVVQLHGNESPALINEIRAAADAKVWKAVRVRDAVTARAEIARYAAHVDGILLDAWSDRGAGGTGTLFDWQALADVRSALPASSRLILAGGLNPENVRAAIVAIGPDVVDVSSGVEVRTGEKSEALMRAFIERAQPTGKEVTR